LGRPVYIVAGKRTPIGAFNGKLSKIPACELGALAIKSVLESIKLPGSEVDECLLGSAMQAGLGPGPARIAALHGGIAPTTACTAVNKLCSSSLKATNIGATNIAYNHCDVVVSGGFESMSLIPYTIPAMRRGAGYGHTTAIDLLPNDLTDPHVGKLMGGVAEKTGRDFKITREMCDKWAVLSYERATKANKEGLLKNSIVPVKISEKETMTEDEEYKNFRREKVSTLKPAFEPNGVLTAVSSSKINDAGIALVLMSEEAMKRYNVKPMARILGIADGAMAPIDFTIAISEAIKPLLRDANLKATDVDYYELNEAFAITALSNAMILGIDHDRLNHWGSAISYGHPIGMSGARVILQVLDVLRVKKGKLGIAGICNAGGEGSAILVENLQ
jgi:acetyl-CoA C-acetyltransferase